MTSIVFTVNRKRPLTQLAPDERLPNEIDGEPTDVVQVPYFEAPRPIPPRQFSNDTHVRRPRRSLFADDACTKRWRLGWRRGMRARLTSRQSARGLR